MANSQHFVYMLQCADGSFYMGYATDVKRRLREHNESPKAAKYTRGRRPLTLAYYEECESRSDALKRENALRKLTRVQKEQLANDFKSNLD
jgi:putative endonuclease